MSKTITQLTETTTIETDDVFHIVDVENNQEDLTVEEGLALFNEYVEDGYEYVQFGDTIFLYEVEESPY